MNDHGSDAEENDPAVEALRQVASRRTVRSVKQTVLACMLIRAVGGSRPPRRHTPLVVALTVAATTVSAHWHILQSLMHLAL